MIQIWYFSCFLIWRRRESFTENILSHETIDPYLKSLHFQCVKFILIGHIFIRYLTYNQNDRFAFFIETYINAAIQVLRF